MSNPEMGPLNFKNRVFSSYVVCSCVLILKMFALGIFMECFEIYLQVNLKNFKKCHPDKTI